jgi:hypothetical protein
MLKLDQIRRELLAILDFDSRFSVQSEHYPEEIMGFEFRKLRKEELLALAETLTSRN